MEDLDKTRIGHTRYFKELRWESDKTNILHILDSHDMEQPCKAHNQLDLHQVPIAARWTGTFRSEKMCPLNLRK